MDKDLSRRERKKMETHQRLMEAASRLFRDRGYDETTVEQIAAAADVAKGTFFNYFETKEAILPALVEWRLQALTDALSPEQGAPASPVARIKLALRLVTEGPLTEPVMAQRLFVAVMHYQQPVVRPGHALMYLLTEQVRQAQAAGEIRADLDPVYLSSMIRTLFFQQVMMWHHGYRSASLPDMLDEAVDVLMNGIAGPQWRQ